MPYLSGERTPHPDPLARGALIGLTVRHRRGDLVRSVMEGVAFGLRDGYTLMRHAGITAADQIRVSGGGTKSQLWLQILADVLGTTSATVATGEGAAYGAAMPASVGGGWHRNVREAAAEWVQVSDAATTSRADYDEVYALYTAQYPLLRETFVRLGDLDS